MSDAPTIRYTGKDPAQAFHESIPARNLSESEYDALDAEQRALVRSSPLYDYAGYRDRKKAAEKAAPAADAAPVVRVEAPKAEEAKADARDEKAAGAAKK